METVQRQILPTVAAFKAFWKKNGPFRYALTSREYPPILLEPEEWIFSNDRVLLLKALMQWDERKMKIVAAPFSKKKKNTLKPDDLSPWRITGFPPEWDGAVCDIFTPVGHLTEAVFPGAQPGGAGEVEIAFFSALEQRINSIGYVLLGPGGTSHARDTADIQGYLAEWQADEQDG